MRWSDRIGRRLKTRDLHVFLAVAERGNMAKAAEQLAISRPVVSKTIADLEHTLGVRLLDRTPHGVEPTIYGKALLKRSLSVFDELRQSVKEIEFLADPGRGELRVGFGEVAAAGLVPAAIARLVRRHPRMTVQTEQGQITTVLDFLRNRRCEVAVGRQNSAAPDLIFEPIHFEQLYVVVGAGRDRLDRAQTGRPTRPCAARRRRACPARLRAPFFLSVMAWRSRKRHTVLGANVALCSLRSISAISPSVMSALVSMASRMMLR